MDTLYIALLIGLIAGILSGILGIGGGIIMIPALVFIFGYNQHLSQGTTLAAMVLPIGLLATLEYYKKGYVNLPVALCIAIGFFFGGLIGAKYATAINAGLLKKLFAVLLISIGLKMLVFK
jgi:uncharacterized protein